MWNMKMKAGTPISILTFLLFGGTIAYACDCAPIGTAGQELARSQAVFIGRVTGIKDTGTYIEATLEVKKTLKGELPDKIVVSTPRFSTSCRYWFEAGKEYLVYASSYKEGKGWADACSRTKRLAEAKKDIRELVKTPKENRKTTASAV
jgi:hypothetical protein